MKVLFWVPPWAAHGDPLFYLNCVKKHLIPQANLLAGAGCSVDFVLPEIMAVERNRLKDSINVIDISYGDQISIFGSFSDVSLDLYKNKTSDFVLNIGRELKKRLSAAYDVILLWETPVPFFQEEYADALIVSQMPGAFSRAPYPHTVVFDPVGLYKDGSLYKDAKNIVEGRLSASSSIAKEFSYEVRKSIGAINNFSRIKTFGKKFTKYKLLPLQVSAHYSFLADSGYSNQSDFLLDVMSNTAHDVGVVVTQYVTPNVSDTVLNKDVLIALRRRWPNLIFKDEFDRVSSVSQLLLPLVDEVATCSSSIGLQAMAWDRNIEVYGDTFLKPYSNLAKNGFSSEICANTLDFLLLKNQPLASFILNDENFLMNIIQEMIFRKKSGTVGADLMPAFNDIDKSYIDKLFSSFEVDKAARTISSASPSWSAQQNDINKFRRALKDENIKVVTFDLFDTLIKRPTEVPADVYKFLEESALKVTQGIAEDFSRVRLNAEVETREASEKGEISLVEIYEFIKNYYGFSQDITDALMRVEIEKEIEFISSRDFGRKLWDIAISSGRPVYIVSDMYLDLSTIERMVEKAGYSGFAGIFLSSEYGVRKKEGGLFDKVLESLKVNGDQVIHLGDNKAADIDQSQSRGMKSFRLLRSIDRMRGSSIYKNIYSPKLGVGERARSAIAGLTAHELFDSPSGDFEKNSHFQGSPYNLGYAALGPMLTGFMLWLGRQAKRDAIDKLYFLSREGWILKQIYDELHRSDTDAVPACYLYASRRSTRVAGLESKGDVLSLAGTPFRAGVSLGDLIGSRFGLDPSKISDEIFKSAGYVNGADEILQSDQISRMKFSGLCAEISEDILENAIAERRNYLKYLRHVGFDSSGKSAVVDIGWKANMQGALGSLIGRPITGYYYATLQGAEVWLSKNHHIWSYCGEMLSLGHPSTVLKNRHMLEYLTCHVESSLVRVDFENNFRPIFRDEENAGNRRSLIEQIHAGAINFSSDFTNSYSAHFSQIHIDSFLGERVFSSFLEKPSSVDAAMFVGHHFEDALGGVKKQYIITPNDRDAVNQSVWKAGAEVVYVDKKLDSPRGAIIPAARAVVNENFPPQSIEEQASIFIRLEKTVVKRFSSEKKYSKYERDRDAFFMDSKSVLLKKWYRLHAVD